MFSIYGRKELLVNGSEDLVCCRFPVADLQPLNKRRPWWVQAVHKEILAFDLKQVHFQSDFDGDEATTLTVTSEAIQGLAFSTQLHLGASFLRFI